MINIVMEMLVVRGTEVQRFISETLRRSETFNLLENLSGSNSRGTRDLNEVLRSKNLGFVKVRNSFLLVHKYFCPET